MVNNLYLYNKRELLPFSKQISLQEYQTLCNNPEEQTIQSNFSDYFYNVQLNEYIVCKNEIISFVTSPENNNNNKLRHDKERFGQFLRDKYLDLNEPEIKKLKIK